MLAHSKRIDTGRLNIPQAGRAPALPVFRDSSLPPLPRSSVPAWQTTVRYISCQQPRKPPVGSPTYANNALGANELDQGVLERALRVALGISLDVAEVTDVALLVGAVTVGRAVGVDWGGRVSSVPCSPIRPGPVFAYSAGTYSEGRPRCSRWCCHQRCGCACHAWRWHRDPSGPTRRWWGPTRRPARR